ncbi:hypothetical protein LSCM1_03262 [Leishmania martiniquensis]|uniref:Uncharacterized protein n=1 Tax=Leishmania martiniquensis TaxID=1580590 RepID=A0A836G3M0_9TRYP|nr:hypothetical protein LSCM1_03262 [Leishmania martiniquensis]
MLADPVAERRHIPPSSSSSSLASSTLSAIQYESAVSVTPCSSSDFSSTSPASMAAKGPAVSGFAAPAKVASAEDDPFSLSSLERRTRALEEERLKYVRLGERAADAFEEHRRELTQLAQKERAIRSHREDALRIQLQETLQANRELTERVAEQRRRHEEACVAELQVCHDGNTRQDALESTLRQLHEEWAEVRRGVVETEASHEECRRRLAACLRDQERLRSRVRSLQAGLHDAEAAAAVAEQYGEEVAMEDGREQAGPAVAPAKGAEDRLAEGQPSRTSVAASSSHTRKPRCPYSEGPPTGWRGPSPARRALRRHFVPSGPCDSCSPCRASSPCTHHVEAMVATIERKNYLRPRLYYRRVGCGSSDMVGAPVAVASPYQQRRGSVYASRPPPPPPAPAAFTSSFSCVPATPPRHGHLSHLQSGPYSPGLSSSTSSSTSTPYTYTATGSSPSTRTCSSCNRAHESSTADASAQSPPAPHRNDCRRETSPHRPQSRCFSPRARGESPREDIQASAGARVPLGSSEPTTAPLSFEVFLRTPSQLPPAADGLHGSALNATCHALIADLAHMRAEYRLRQRQLRDPHGDSVTASQEMRRLMHEMDRKADQIRALRREQGRHNDALRVQDVLREVMAENRYCESVYRDLLELIRS